MVIEHIAHGYCTLFFEDIGGGRILQQLIKAFVFEHFLSIMGPRMSDFACLNLPYFTIF